MISQSVKTMICPSAPHPSMTYTDNTSFPPFVWTAAVADYAPNDVINEPTFFGYPSTTSQAALTGALQPSIKGTPALLAMLGVAPTSHANITGITDGTSNTILLCEDAGRPIRWINNTQFPSRNTNGAPGGAICSASTASTASRSSPIQLCPPGQFTRQLRDQLLEQQRNLFVRHRWRQPRLLRWVSSLHSGIHFRKHLRRLDYRGGRRSHSRGSLPQF